MLKATLWVKRFEHLSFGVVFLALIAASLIRINMTDSPWHLATAKFAFEEGNFLSQNHFSYTYPDYPTFQQYPIYQLILLLIFRAFGWEGLSIFHCIAWVVIYSLWLKWAKPDTRKMAALSLAWILALLGFQRRMILRPDIMSLFFFICILLVFDSYRKGKTWTAAVLVAMQFFLVNSHQLFPLGICFQIAFIIHLAIVKNFGGKYGVDESDAELPMLPLTFALSGSILVCYFSPLGMNIYTVSLHTASSLQHHTEHVQELTPFYSNTYSMLLAFFSTFLAVAGVYRRRNSWQPFEVGLWIIVAVILSAAIRGISLYTMVCIGIFGRSFTDACSVRTKPQGRDKAGELILRAFCASLSLAITVGIIYERWVTPARILGGTQPGIGLALGVWPYETTKFIRENPPPGEMINLSWYTGNPLIFDLYPQHRVFVDPRFESYPREFLLKAIEAERNRRVLEELICKYEPDWMILEIRLPHLRQLAVELIKENSWVLVHADTVLLTLIRNSPKNANYIVLHELNPQDIAPKDFLYSEPDLKALQEIRMAGLFADFGMKTESEEMIRNAELVADRYVSVRSELKVFMRSYSEYFSR
jgi:hypothetical protein